LWQTSHYDIRSHEEGEEDDISGSKELREESGTEDETDSKRLKVPLPGTNPIE
jgi:hypothetical protein